MCGEKSGFCQRSILHLGSPPRMRGKAIVIQRVDRLGGITPAYAGKSQTAGCRTAAPEDHPRVCGEKTSSNVPERKNPGSPPRMQGKGCPLLFRYYFIGITPACAGKSQQGNRLMSWVWDHPRVCGEKRWKRRTSSCMAGSPPRVRGKARRGACSGLPGWITPACAGKRDLTGS